MNEIEYKNPYTVKKNTLIWLYCFFENKRFSKPLHYLHYGLSLVFKRIAFELVKRKAILPTTATYAGRTFSIRSTNSQFHSIYFPYYAQCYEPDVFAAIDCFLPDRGVFIDIGSNWGHHTFIAALEKNATVFSFEPNPEVFGDLVSIAKGLNCQDQIHASNVGVGATATSFNLVQTQFESGVASVSSAFLNGPLLKTRWPQRLLDNVTFNTPISRRVDVVPLDSVIPQDLHVNLIKVDAEGAEMDCLIGMKSILQRSDAKVLFELHTDEAGDFSEFRSFFADVGYMVYEITTNLKDQSCSFRRAEKLKPCSQYNLIASKTELEPYWFI